MNSVTDPDSGTDPNLFGQIRMDWISNGFRTDSDPILTYSTYSRLNASNVHHNTKTIIFDKFFFRTFLLRHTNIYLVQSRTIFGFGRCEKSDPDL